MAGIGDWDKRQLERWLEERLIDGIEISAVKGLGDFLAGLLEPGAVVAFGGGQPHGFLPADGSAVSREDFAGLFNRIGTTFGAGDGSSTFNVPNVANLAANLPYYVKT